MAEGPKPVKPTSGNRSVQKGVAAEAQPPLKPREAWGEAPSIPESTDEQASFAIVDPNTKKAAPSGPTPPPQADDNIPFVGNQAPAVDEDDEAVDVAFIAQQPAPAPAPTPTQADDNVDFGIVGNEAATAADRAAAAAAAAKSQIIDMHSPSTDETVNLKGSPEIALKALTPAEQKELDKRADARSQDRTWESLCRQGRQQVDALRTLNLVSTKNPNKLAKHRAAMKDYDEVGLILEGDLDKAAQARSLALKKLHDQNAALGNAAAGGYSSQANQLRPDLLDPPGVYVDTRNRYMIRHTLGRADEKIRFIVEANTPDYKLKAAVPPVGVTTWGFAADHKRKQRPIFDEFARVGTKNLKITYPSPEGNEVNSYIISNMRKEIHLAAKRGMSIDYDVNAMKHILLMSNRWPTYAKDKHLDTITAMKLMQEYNSKTYEAETNKVGQEIQKAQSEVIPKLTTLLTDIKAANDKLKAAGINDDDKAKFQKELDDKIQEFKDTTKALKGLVDLTKKDVEEVRMGEKVFPEGRHLKGDDAIKGPGGLTERDKNINKFIEREMAKTVNGKPYKYLDEKKATLKNSQEVLAERKTSTGSTSKGVEGLDKLIDTIGLSEAQKNDMKGGLQSVQKETAEIQKLVAEKQKRLDSYQVPAVAAEAPTSSVPKELPAAKTPAAPAESEAVARTRPGGGGR